MTEYHVRQFDGGSTYCDGRNCAAASGAMAVAFGSAGRHTPSADEFRLRSGQSCVPGVHSASGGLFISDIERVAASYGVTIDYGREAGGLKRWTATEERERLMDGFGMVCLGDYDQLPAALDAQPGFNGDHSTFIHAYRTSDGTVCWHDPLARGPVRAKWSTVVAYNQKAGSPVKGLAGFVRIPAPPPPDTSTEDIVRNFTILYDAGRVIPATLTFPDAGASALILATGKLVPVNTAWTKQGIKVRLIDPIIAGKPRTDDWMLGWLIGDNAAFVLDRNVVATRYPASDPGAILAARRAEYDRVKAGAKPTVALNLPARP